MSTRASSFSSKLLKLAGWSAEPGDRRTPQKRRYNVPRAGVGLYAALACFGRSGPLPGPQRR